MVRDGIPTDICMTLYILVGRDQLGYLATRPLTRHFSNSDRLAQTLDTYLGIVKEVLISALHQIDFGKVQLGIAMTVCLSVLTSQVTHAVNKSTEHEMMTFEEFRMIKRTTDVNVRQANYKRGLVYS